MSTQLLGLPSKLALNRSSNEVAIHHRQNVRRALVARGVDRPSDSTLDIDTRYLTGTAELGGPINLVERSGEPRLYTGGVYVECRGYALLGLYGMALPSSYTDSEVSRGRWSGWAGSCDG